ncbi:MAG: C4-dicarboxylate ABC transporter [Bryobacterales bacterium]|nr:C4-dicarboxylate ABC transporter [Bryobacterales bacterium]
MTLAWLSLGALFLAILISCTTRLNVGIVALSMAWIIGVYAGGLSPAEVMSGFPASLFLTLTGVTLLFTQAQTNRTLDKLAHHAVLSCRGNTGLIPVMFFFLAVCLATMGPGNIATAALMAPMAMVVGARAGVPAFLMAIMVGNGANAGSLSPFAPTGIIVNGIMARIGMEGLEWQSYFANFIAHSTVAFGGYFLFGGWRLFGVRYVHTPEPGEERGHEFDRDNWVTLGVILALICGVIFFRVHVGLAAFAGATLLGLLRAAEHGESVRKIPWGVIVMVSGITVLISLLEKTHGMDLFTDLLARMATAQSVTAMVAFLTGLISVYSSTSGVVLPAFLPTVPGLAERLGGIETVPIAMSMNVGSHLVDVSPLSTIGALCIAAIRGEEESRSLFNKLLAWGLSMTLVGAAVCWLFFGHR